MSDGRLNVNSSCSGSALYAPKSTDVVWTDLNNHQTFEAWAVFPEVDKSTTTVDLTLLADGIPAFTDLAAVVVSLPGIGWHALPGAD